MPSPVKSPKDVRQIEMFACLIAMLPPENPQNKIPSRRPAPRAQVRPAPAYPLLFSEEYLDSLVGKEPKRHLNRIQVQFTATSPKAARPQIPVIWPTPQNIGYWSAKSSPANTSENIEVDVDEAPCIFDPSLLVVTNGDNHDVVLAKSMFERMAYDLSYKGKPVKPNEEPPADASKPSAKPLMGKRAMKRLRQDHRMLNKINAIIWLYGFHPQEARLSAEWVCDTLSMDVEGVRRIVARSLKAELMETIALLAPFTGLDHAMRCQEQVSDYVNVSGWYLH